MLMSLWRIPDKQTCQLMEDFYVNWLGGSSKRDALRGAVLKLVAELRDEFGYAHPYLWGGTVLAGDPD